MNQLTLFDRPHKRARSADPETSHKASADIDCKTAKLKAACLDILGMTPEPMTANELGISAAIVHGGDPQSYRKRMHEIVREGLVVIAGKRPCETSGKKCMTYKLRPKP
jgi:hypothetical protein